MIVHLFNSSSVSGPERLVLPALAALPGEFTIVNLVEERIHRLRDAVPLEDYARSFKLPYRPVAVRGRWDRDAFRRLANLFRELKPAVVHAHAIKASVYLRQAKAVDPTGPYPIVSTHHGVHGLPDWKVRLYEWFYRKHILPRFDRVLAVSTADRDFLEISGIRPERLRLHRNGVDMPLIPPEVRPRIARDIRARWLPDEPNRDSLFLFGVAARFSQEKDYPRLFESLAALNRLGANREWRCLVFGMGDLGDELHRLVEKLGLTGRVLWMGHRKGVGEELAGLDLLLSFSKAEGLPINLIEAGWAGTPVCCTPVGGVTELVPNERFGNWIPRGELPQETGLRLKALLAAPEKLSAQAAALQKRVTSDFTQASWMRTLIDIYTELKVTVPVPA